MGHSDVSTTMNIYAEVNESTTKESLEKLAKIGCFWGREPSLNETSKRTAVSNEGHKGHQNVMKMGINTNRFEELEI